MSLNDLISDVLSRIRNGQKARHSHVFAHSSKAIKSVLDVMIREGYISSYEEFEDRPGVKTLRIDLKYFEGQPVISEIKRVSKPGRRVYTSIKDLFKVFSGLGISILSTSKGMLSDEEARLHRVGGEIVCTIF
jgi:small subunit ribosomal protein S8